MSKNPDYARGYQAGRRAPRRMTDGEFYDAVILAVVNDCAHADAWTQTQRDGSRLELSTVEQRMGVAHDIAMEVLRNRRKAGPA